MLFRDFTETPENAKNNKSELYGFVPENLIDNRPDCQILMLFHPTLHYYFIQHWFSDEFFKLQNSFELEPIFLKLQALKSNAITKAKFFFNLPTSLRIEYKH